MLALVRLERPSWPSGATTRGATLNESSLDTAAREFWWKPAHAWFRSLELHAYEAANIMLSAPVLDLGCGDGTVARTLITRGVAVQENLVGLDYQASALERARVARGHWGLVRADARDLPFPDASFQSVVANGVLCAIPGGVERSLDEVARVLRPGGVFTATVPTDRFLQTLFWPRTLSRISRSIEARYLAHLDRRLDHLNPYLSVEEWRERWRSSGVTVDRVEGFFSDRAGKTYSLLAMQVFRTFGILRYAPSAFRRAATAGLRIGLGRAYAREISRTSRPGYVLVVGHRMASDLAHGGEGPKQ